MKAYVPEIHIKQKGDVLVTTSIDVAEKFGKQHAHVLRDIRKLCEDSTSQPDEPQSRSGLGGIGAPKIEGTYFSLTSYHDEQGQSRPMYYITRDGFSLLAMGFTGKKALAWKVKYISTFSKMESALLTRTQPRWIEDRREGKLSRREETDAVSSFIKYAQGQGSTKGHFYYKHFTNATYKALFVIADQFPGFFRDLLNTKQLRRLAVAEDLVTEIIIEGMGRGLFYKDIFRVAKKRLEDYAASVGVSTVISPALMLPTMSRQVEARP